MTKPKYKVPRDWETRCDGAACCCCAYNQSECGCDADWTPREVYELKLEVNMLRAALERIDKTLEGVIQ